MVRKISLNVHNSTDVTDYYIKELLKSLDTEYKKLKVGNLNPIVASPGFQPICDKPYYKTKTVYFEDLLNDKIITKLKKRTSRDLIVKNCHKLHPRLVEKLIELCIDQTMDIHFFGQVKDVWTSAIYSTINLLTEDGCEVNELDDSPTKEDLSKKVFRGNEKIPTRSRKVDPDTFFNELKGKPGRVPDNQFTAEYLFQQAENLHTHAKRMCKKKTK